jgi:uncharacterized RDD family membrane protein YckC
MDVLDGLPLAGFWQRAVGFGIDNLLLFSVWVCLVAGWKSFISHKLHGSTRLEFSFDWHAGPSLFLLILYFSLSTYYGNGQTLGKRIAGSRVVSLVHERLGLWQCVERVLGYGVATAEGIGFVQYFWSTNRMCVQDRMAETIVVDVRKKATRLVKVEEAAPELEPEADLHVVDAVLDGDLGEGDAGGGGVAGGEHAGEVQRGVSVL